MSSQPEGLVVKAILTVITKIPRSWCFKCHGGPFQIVGIPDIIGCIDGRFVAIEIKDPGRKAFTASERGAIAKLRALGIPCGTAGGCSVIQGLHIKRIVAAGGRAGVATSVEEAFTVIGMEEPRGEGERT